MAKVDIEKIKGNSYTDRASSSQSMQEQGREKLKPVVKSEDVRIGKKKGKFLKAVFQEEASELKERMVYDVIIPGIKHWILDGLNQMFFHGNYRDSYYSYGRNSWERRDYGSYYRGSSSRFEDRKRGDRYYKEPVDYRNVVLKNRYDAERIVRELCNRIRDRGYACVADLFDLINVPGDISWENWGWKDERDIFIREVRDGWLIDVREAGYVGR